jgi:outer membrane protein
METSSRRSALAVGLGLGGLLGLVGRASGQQGGRDAAVRRASNTPGAAGSTSQAIPPAVIGTIDFDAVVAGYAKAKAIIEQLKQFQASRMREMTKLETEGKDLEASMQKLSPTSPDFKDYENKLTLIQAKYQATGEQIKRDFMMKRTEGMATIYKEIQEITAYVAKGRRLTHVIKVSNEPVSASDPRTLQLAEVMPLLWADPATDLTPEVLRVLNSQYQKAQAAQAENAPAAARAGNAPAAAAKPKDAGAASRK